jgi:hypothetical protein
MTISNVTTLEQVRKDIAELAKEGGRGKDTQIKAAVKVAQAAYEGGIDLDPKKHGKPGVTDATVLAEDFVTTFTGALVFDTKAPTVMKLVSIYKRLISFAANPKYGPGQPMQQINDYLTARQKARAKGGRKLEDALNGFMRFVRAQAKEDTLLTPDEFDQFIFKKETEVRTGREVLEGLRKTVIALRKGQVSNCPDKDDSAETQQVLSYLNQRIGKLAGNTP